jgi:hypothetical protein
MGEVEFSDGWVRYEGTMSEEAWSEDSFPSLGTCAVTGTPGETPQWKHDVSYLYEV